MNYEVHFDKLCEIVLSSNTNDSFMLMGDYNLNISVTWTFDNKKNIYDATTVDGPIANSLLDFLALCSINPLVSEDDHHPTIQVLLHEKRQKTNFF